MDAADAPCPISALLLSRMVDADRHGRRAMALSLSEDRRAELALFLYDDPDLQHVACDVANACDPVMLIRKGGAKGIAVLAAAEELPGRRAPLTQTLNRRHFS
jgi:hypothetical protein